MCLGKNPYKCSFGKTHTSVFTGKPLKRTYAILSFQKVIKRTPRRVFFTVLNMYSKGARREIVLEPQSADLNVELIEEIQGSSSERFKRYEKIFRYKMTHNLGNFHNLYEASDSIDRSFEQIMEPHLAVMKDNDFIAVSIKSEHLVNDIFIPPIQKINFKKEAFLDTVFDIAQSNSEFLLDGEFIFNIAISKNTSGTGAPETISERSHLKRSVIPITNSDNGSFFRALYLGMLKLTNPSRNIWDLNRKDSRNRQEIGAKKRAKQCEFLYSSPVTRNDLSNIQEKIGDTQIIIVDSMNTSNLIFRGPDRNKKVYLEFLDDIVDGGHYNLITNIKGYMGRCYYCDKCHKAFQEKYLHRCKNSCPSCHAQEKHDGEIILCGSCHRNFLGETCYDYHKLSGLCKHKKRCEKCEREFYANTKHECDEYRCTLCDTRYTQHPHFCHFKPLK